MKRFVRLPSPAMVVACASLFVALGGVSYAFATGSIGSREIHNGSITQPRREEPRPARPGHRAGQRRAQRRQGGGARLAEARAGGERRRGPGRVAPRVVAANGATVRARGATSTARTGTGQYQAIFDRDVRNCVYVATLGDESASAPGTGQVSVTSLASSVNGVRVLTRDSSGAPANRSFHLIVSC